jgi:hypothetical protein
VTRTEQLERQFEALGEQFELLREQFRVDGALRLFERFHAFDAIRDDKCPCCGARVAVEDNEQGTGVRLKAVV